jgi:hypothetical protein
LNITSHTATVEVEAATGITVSIRIFITKIIYIFIISMMRWRALLELFNAGDQITSHCALARS